MSSIITGNSGISNKTIDVLIIVIILGVIIFSVYESFLDPDKRDDPKLNFGIILFINILLLIGGFLTTVVANYIVEVYSLKKIDNKLVNIIEKVKPRVVKKRSDSKLTNLVELIVKDPSE